MTEPKAVRCSCGFNIIPWTQVPDNWKPVASCSGGVMDWYDENGTKHSLKQPPLSDGADLALRGLD